MQKNGEPVDAGMLSKFAALKASKGDVNEIEDIMRARARVCSLLICTHLLFFVYMCLLICMS